LFLEVIFLSLYVVEKVLMGKSISKNSKLSFFKRITTKFKVSIINEGTLEEVSHLRLSALWLFASSFFLIGIILVLFSVIILYTPLRGFLPENVNDDLRVNVTTQAIKIDSLTNVVALQNQYLDVLKGIISGDIKIDTTDKESAEILASKREEILLEKSEAEKEFAKSFEEDEMYNISSPSQTENSIIFFKPVAGIIASGYDPKMGKFGIEISTKPDAAISAAYKGLVFNTGYDFHDGYFIEIVHPQNYITIYKGLGASFVKCGDTVKEGQVIGTLFNNSSDTKPHIHFELWNNAQSQDPLNYISFE